MAEQKETRQEKQLKRVMESRAIARADARRKRSGVMKGCQNILTFEGKQNQMNKMREKMAQCKERLDEVTASRQMGRNRQRIVDVLERIDDETTQIHVLQQQNRVAEHRSQLDKEAVVKQLF